MTRNPSCRLPGRDFPGRALLALITALLLTVGFTSRSLAQGQGGADLRITTHKLGSRNISSPRDVRRHQQLNRAFPVHLIVWNHRAATPPLDADCDPADGPPDNPTPPCAATTLHVYASADRTITSADMQLATRTVNTFIRGTENMPVGREFGGIMVTLSSTGTFFIGACVDAVEDEIDTNNNCTIGRHVQQVDVASYPDLAVSVANITATPARGADFTITATLRNVGLAASASSTVRYWLAGGNLTNPWPESAGRGASTELATVAVGGISAGSSASRTATVSIANSGTHYVSACVDPVPNERPPQLPFGAQIGVFTPSIKDSNNCSSGVAVTVTAR